ncbi:unnamed protein product, partial [Mesorhabditis spiculigera]
MTPYPYRGGRLNGGMSGFPSSSSYNNAYHAGTSAFAPPSNQNGYRAGAAKQLLAPGSEVVVTRSVSPGGAQHDVVFRKDERVRITAPTADPAWFRARNMNLEDGLIHVDYIRSASADHLGPPHDPPQRVPSREFNVPIERQAEQTIHMPWFHKDLSRERTERLLQHKADGTFLVRESTNYPGDYTLSMAYRAKVEHYRIYQAGGQLTCDNEEFFSNLTQLVSHYKRDADGLCHRLVTPIINEAFRMPSTQTELEDKVKIFRSAGLVIPSSQLKLGDIIGHGEFGDVLLGIHNDRKVAVKVTKRGVAGGGMSECLLDEARFMVDVSHRNLVGLVGVVVDDCDVFMLTEYMANGNLVDFLRSRGRHQLDRAHLLQFSIDICQGMCYLESRQIVHRDLAARNILLDDGLVAKISDFGLAKKAHAATQDSASGKFPIKWTAPEALRHSKFSTKSDVWSFAVLLWEIFSFGRVPYPRIPIQDVVRHIERGYRMEAPEGCPNEITRLMTKAWSLQPQDRPSFGQMAAELQTISRTPDPQPA